MQLPFSAEQFFGVFRAYNTTVWPAQVLLLAAAIAAIALVFRPRHWSSLAVSAILAALWAWLGLAYHLAFFAAINPLAYVFGMVSVAGSVAFLWQGVVLRRLQFRWAPSPRAWGGIVLVAFSLLVYPAWSSVSGHHYPALPTFGLPCPTTLFTLGLLGLATPPFPRITVVVPLVWCFVGAQAAFLLGVQADLGLVVAAAFGVVLFVRSRVAIAASPASP